MESKILLFGPVVVVGGLFLTGWLLSSSSPPRPPMEKGKLVRVCARGKMIYRFADGTYYDEPYRWEFAYEIPESEIDKVCVAYPYPR
jgi:hypothetical protein